VAPIWVVQRQLAAGAGDEGGDDLGGVPVKGLAAPVVSHGGAWICVAGRFLHVAERDTGVEGGGDEGMPEAVRADVFVEPSGSGDAAHDPAGRVAIHPPTGDR
jgi:hypothetical protein